MSGPSSDDVGPAGLPARVVADANGLQLVNSSTPSVTRLRREVAEAERRLSVLEARAERRRADLSEALAAELAVVRDRLARLDREHAGALAALDAETEAEAAQILADAQAFVEAQGLSVPAAPPTVGAER